MNLGGWRNSLERKLFEGGRGIPAFERGPEVLGKLLLEYFYILLYSFTRIFGLPGLTTLLAIGWVPVTVSLIELTERNSFGQR